MEGTRIALAPPAPPIINLTIETQPRRQSAAGSKRKQPQTRSLKGTKELAQPHSDPFSQEFAQTRSLKGAGSVSSSLELAQSQSVDPFSQWPKELAQS